MELHYHTPTRYDVAPFGTCWKVVHDGSSEVFIQLSHDKENPAWQKMAYFLEKALERYYDNQDFVIHMLQLYESEKFNFFETNCKS